MIASKDLSTLLPASEVAAVADSAISSLLEGSVARAINSNANVGEKQTEYTGELTGDLKSKLIKLGYSVRNKKDANSKEIPNVYIITSR